MDWFNFAQNDWESYQDINRIKNYVKMGKISEADYSTITGESYA